MRTLFLPVLCSLVLVGHAAAGEFKLPVGKPVATVEVPDAWQPEAIKRGVQAQTEDSTVYLSVEGTTDAADMSKIIDESDAMLKTRKVSLNRVSYKDNRYKLSDLPAEELAYTGRDEDGAVTVVFTFVTVGDGAVVFTYWASVEGDKKHRSELTKIMNSLKATPRAATSTGAKP